MSMSRNININIHFLGNGGFISKGLPYNSFLLNDNFLIESPPDNMVSLHNQKIDISKINKIFLSHFHGDHYFGMPFFTLNLMNLYMELGQPKLSRIDLIGPRNIRNYILEIQRIAVSPDNPSIKWIDQIYNFQEIDESSTYSFDVATRMIFHKMSHEKETYGFSIIQNNKYRMTYFPDTCWDDSFISILNHKPKYVICDLNSTSNDKIKVHMSELDIVEKAIPITGNETKYIGTHIREDRSSRNKYITYAKAGMKFKI
jgi:metal-dependent hydrolase (beta-lactamase superfamily II)